MSEAVKDLIQQALDADYNKANKIFSDVMTIKVQDVLDQEKVRLADQIYNGAEPEDEDDITDEDLEDEIEDEEGIQEPDTDAEEPVGDEDESDEDEGLEREADTEGDPGSEES